jgi:hypothetical protein
VNTGGGGGGGGYLNVGSPNAKAGGAGGSGICIISYSGIPRGIGGELSTVGSNTVHTFTFSGGFTA